MSLVQLSCRRYQPRGVPKALSWRAAWRRLGSQMVVGVRGGCSGSRGAWRGVLLRCYASWLMYGWSWAGQVGLGGARWSR